MAQDALERLNELEKLIVKASSALPRRLMRDIDANLEELAARIMDQLRAAQTAGNEERDDLDRYFPTGRSLRTKPTPAEVRSADEFWRDTVARQPRIRAAARHELGRLLRPAEVAHRLGVTPATVSNRRNKGEMLGVRLNKREYLYPEWQFSDSPRDAALGVWPGLDDVLRALGEAHPWEKAQFLLSELPEFGGRRPIEILRERGPDELSRLLAVAAARGEMGT